MTIMKQVIHVYGASGSGTSTLGKYISEKSGYYFMDTETYDQIPLNRDSVEDALNYVKENENCTMYFYKGNPFSVYPPTFVELEVIDCEPGVQGDTAKSSTKPAKVETGYVLNVPLFINIGDRIRIDTRDGSYMERVK